MSPRSTSKLRFKPRFQTSMVLAKLEVNFCDLSSVCLFVCFVWFFFFLVVRLFFLMPQEVLEARSNGARQNN